MLPTKQTMINFIKNCKKEKENKFVVFVEKGKRQFFAEKIFMTLKQNKSIYIFGDYDVDGIASTAMTIDILNVLTEHCGFKQPRITFKIPARADCYGITREMFLKAKKSNEVVMTLDNGTHTDFFKTLGNEDKENLSIIDHHSNWDFTKEKFIINPNKDRRVKTRTGILNEIVFQTLKRAIKSYGEVRPENHYHDLVAMTLISDVAILNNGIVRTYIESGIKKAGKRDKTIFKELMSKCKGNPTLSAFAFEILPIINSIGRLHSNLNWVVDLLLKKDKNSEFYELLNSVIKTNTQREEASDSYTKKLIAALRLMPEKEFGRKIIFTHDENIPIGLNGVIAFNIFSNFGADTVVMPRNFEGGGTIVGTRRGVVMKDNLSNIASTMWDNSDTILNFGGQNQVVGVKIGNWGRLEEVVDGYSTKEVLECDNIFKKEKIYITDEYISIADFKAMAQIFYEILGSDIKFIDEFYVNIRAIFIEFEEYRNGFAKVTICDNSFNEISFLTKRDEKTNYFLSKEKIISVSFSLSQLDKKRLVVPASIFEFKDEPEKKCDPRISTAA